ncbi:MAG TPA: LCP family protein [Thermoleophilia bacterium]|nr:LCP family protein [Thermoleophilia bacterium]
MATLGSRRARAVRVAVATIAALTTVAVGLFAYVYIHLDHNIRTFTPEGLSTSRPPVATPAAPTAQAPLNLLLIGSDSRTSGNEALGGGSDVGGARSDTTILLHISGDRKHAIGVSIPRDSLVDIPACEANGTVYPPQTDAMFNTAFSEGGLPDGNPSCTQNTVEAMTRIRIDHTIVLDFTGFATMSSAIGGVQVCVPQVDNTQLEQSYGITLTPGLQTLSGKNALEYVRAREGFGDNSDIGRMKRQQAFLSALVKKIIDTGVYSNPLALYRLADAATSSLTVDPSLVSVGALENLAMQFESIPLKNVEFVTAPWQYDGSRVDLIEPDTSILWSLLRADKTLEGADASGASTPSATPATGTDSPAPTVTGTGSADTAPSVAAQSQQAAKLQGLPSADAGTGGGSGAANSPLPSVIPSGITDNIRPADSDPCSDLNYGQSQQ